MKEIGERIKERMLGALVLQHPTVRGPGRLSNLQRSSREDCGWQISLINSSLSHIYFRSKYIAVTQVNENVGQGGR